MATAPERERRPRGSGSIQWRNGRPYAVYRDVLTGKPTWAGFDNEEQADAFLAQWAADKKAARVAAKAATADRAAAAPQRRPPGSSEPWTFGQVLTDWEERHRDGVQESTMRDYGPALNDLRRALGVACSPRGLTVQAAWVCGSSRASFQVWATSAGVR